MRETMRDPGLQLELPLAQPPRTAVRRLAPLQGHQLAAVLERLAREPIRLTMHDNRSTMVSFRRVRGTLELRLHHMFLSAQQELLEAIVDFATLRRGRSRAGRAIDAFVRAHQQDIRPPKPRASLEPRGRHHDLARLYSSLNERWFAGAIDARIGWGRLPPARRRRTIKMGAYYHDTRTILIHPALDRPEVPELVVEFVVYHEMLHQAVPPTRGPTGRKRIHPTEFKERERRHPSYAGAIAWEKEHLSIL
ncbi:MAG: hypothetical protein ACYCWW_11845, partial [Deltaproteobacteria bacterium]